MAGPTHDVPKVDALANPDDWERYHRDATFPSVACLLTLGTAPAKVYNISKESRPVEPLHNSGSRLLLSRVFS